MPLVDNVHPVVHSRRCAVFVGWFVDGLYGLVGYLEVVYTFFWSITSILWCTAFANRLSMLLLVPQPVFVGATAPRG